MTSRELLRRLRRLGAGIVPGRGKGGHVLVLLDGRRSVVPTGSGDLPAGTLAAIRKDLGLRRGPLHCNAGAMGGQKKEKGRAFPAPPRHAPAARPSRPPPRFCFRLV